MGIVVAKEVARAECSPDAVLALRKRVYEMLELGVPMPAFFRDLTIALLERAKGTPETRQAILTTMAEHEAAACGGQNVVHHLEAAFAASLSLLSCENCENVSLGQRPQQPQQQQHSEPLPLLAREGAAAGGGASGVQKKRRGRPPKNSVTNDGKKKGGGGCEK
jgi:hypothetical protein